MNTTMQLSDIFKNIIFTSKLVFKINKSFVFITLAAFMLQTALPIINMYFVKEIIDAITGRKEVKLVLLLVVIMAAANLSGALFNRWISAHASQQTEKTAWEIKYYLGTIVAKMKYSDIEQPRIKNFISLAESNSFTEIITSATGIFLAFINLITYATIVLFVQPWIALILGVSLVLQFFLRKAKLYFDYKWEVIQMPHLNKQWYMQEVILNAEYRKELRVNQLKDWILKKEQKQYEEVCKKDTIECCRLQGIIDIFSNTIKLIETVVVYLMLAYKVVFSSMSLGDYSFYLTSAFNLTEALRSFVSSISNMLENGMFAKDFRYLVTLSDEAELEGTTGKLANAEKIEIEFRNISFKYPNTERYVLKNISFKIYDGEKISLIGVNGAGKTTIVKLICKFYEPTEGEIFINGVSINELNQKDIAQKLSIIFQDFKLFPFSIAENVAVGTSIDEQRAKNCLEQSGVLKKVRTLPYGINTSLTKEFDPEGIELSGGEGQKVAIARAFYKDAPLVILDEPTSALDPIAEYDIYKSFATLTSNRTAIYISHRLTTTRFTDRIFVLSEGEICESGTHSELMQIEDGIYRNMFESQAQYYI